MRRVREKDDMKWRNCVSVSQGKIICNNLIIHDSCYMLCVAKGKKVLATNSFAILASNLNLVTMFNSHIKRSSVHVRNKGSFKRQQPYCKLLHLLTHNESNHALRYLLIWTFYCHQKCMALYNKCTYSWWWWQNLMWKILYVSLSLSISVKEEKEE